MSYDSKDDTIAHMATVDRFMGRIILNLRKRNAVHDDSKLEEPEKSMYDEFTPKLRAMTYGSDEYRETLAAMGPALQHHYAANSHHPEHYENGINGMSLLDLIEMLADWKAAAVRHADGSIAQSMEVNRKRFGMSDQLYEIFQNTIKELGW